MRGIAAALTRIRLVNLREIRTHRLRLITSLTVVMISSALLVAVLGTYGSFTESVAEFNARISGAADIEIAAIADSGIDGRLLGEIRRETGDSGELSGIRAAVPMIRGTVEIDDNPGGPARETVVLGSDLQVTALSGEIAGAAGSRSFTPADLVDGVIAGPGTGLRAGQRLSIGGTAVRVLDVPRPAAADRLNAGNYLFAYLGLAQRLTGLDGRVDSILVVTRPGADVGALRARLGRLVDGRAVVVDPGFRTRQAAVASSVTRDSTLLVSLISLVIAAFLVFNTMNMAVASRRQSLAMLRALGAKRLHLVADMLGEAALFGLVGGGIGVPIGIAAGRWAVSTVPPISRDSVSIAVDYHLAPYMPVVAVAACVFACVAATALAARSVFAVSPVEAMTPGEVADATPRRGPAVWLSAITGGAAVAGGWVIALVVPDRPAIIAGAVYAVGALLLCFALTGPLVGLVVWVARRLGGPGRLASVNAERAPRRAWATLMTVAVAIAVGMGTSGALDNLVASMSRSLDGLADPDFYVSSSTKDKVPLGPMLPSALADEVRAVPGVREVIDGSWATVNVGDSQILLQGLVPGSRAPFLRKASASASARVLAGDGMLMSNVLARSLGVHAGDRLRLATPTGYHDVVIRETVDYVAINSGTAAISSAVLSRWFDRPGATYLQVMTTPDADTAQVRADLERIAARYRLTGGKRPSVYTGAEALAATQAEAAKSGSFTIAIQWIVSGAAAIALLNTLLLSVIERRRELGVLRALGASGQFVSRMVVAEAAAVALVGAAIGLVIGVVLHVLSDRILSATTSLDIAYSPRPITVVYVGVSVLLCLVGALVPARRAARMTITEAISEE
ncbi:MAG: FtsX-like permease family protein [Gordonia sp. (in: high G+C Gram-positive bacteria)]